MKNTPALLFFSLLPFLAYGQSNSSALDLMSDDFEVLKTISNNFIKKQYPNAKLENASNFGVSLKSFGKDLVHPKTGFVGYDLGADQRPRIAKFIKLIPFIYTNPETREHQIQ